MTQRTMIIGPQFLKTSPLNLTIAIKDASHFIVVTDVNGNVVFKVKRQTLSLPIKLLLLDAAGNTIITMHPKARTLHNRFTVHRGDSTSDRDFLFSVKLSSLLKWKRKIDVFLAANTSESVCDFRIKGGESKNEPCNIYLGESSHLVAQVHKKNGEPTGLTVYPNVDYAFIVVLMVTIHLIDGAAEARKLIAAVGDLAQ